MENVSYLIAIGATLVAAFSQLLLKRSANETNGKGFWQKFLNLRVIIGYGLLFLSLFMNSMALRVVDLGMIPGITAIGFIWVLLISIFILKEKPTKYRILGTLIIFVGVIVSKL